MSISRGILIEAILLAEKRNLANYNELLKVYYDSLETTVDFYKQYTITIPKNISKLSFNLIDECVNNDNA